MTQDSSRASRGRIGVPLVLAVRPVVVVMVVAGLLGALLSLLAWLQGGIAAEWDHRAESASEQSQDWQSLVIDEADVGGWAAYESQYVPVQLEAYGSVNYTLARTTVAAYERVFLRLPGPLMLRVNVIEQRTGAIARVMTAAAGRGDRTDVRLTAGDGTYSRGRNGTSPVVAVDFSKGRVRVQVAVVEPEGAVEDADWDALLSEAVTAANAQYAKIPFLPDIPEEQVLAFDGEQVWLWLVGLLFIFGLAAAGTSASSFGDTGAGDQWRRLAARVRRENAPVARGCELIDVSRNADLLAWNQTVRTALLWAGVGVLATAEYFGSPLLFGRSNEVGVQGLSLLIGVLALCWTVHVVATSRVRPPGGRRGSILHWLSGLGVLACSWGALTSWFTGAAAFLMSTIGVLTEYAAVVTALTGADVGLCVSLMLLPGLLARRLGRNAVRTAVAADERRPVLLLRSFADDPIRVRVRPSPGRSNLERMMLGVRARFEEWAGWKLWDVGPVTGISRPGAKPTRPIPVLQELPGDKDWSSRVVAEAARSSLVAVMLDRSPTILDEVALLQRASALPRTVFLIPPLSPDESARRLRVLANALGFAPATAAEWSRRGRHPLAVHLAEDGSPVVVVSATRTSQAYQIALDGCRVLAGRQGLVAGLPWLDAAKQATEGQLDTGFGTQATWQQRLGLRGLGWRQALTGVFVGVALVALIQALSWVPPSTTVELPGSLFAPVAIADMAPWGEGAVGLGRDSDEVFSISPAGVQSIGSVEPGSVQVAASSSRIVVRQQNPGGLAAYDLVDAKLVKAWGVALPNGLQRSRGLAIAGGFVATADSEGDSLLIFSLDDGALSGEVPVGAMPWDVASDGENFLAVIPGQDALQVVDPALLRLLDPIPVQTLTSSVQVVDGVIWAVSVSGEEVVRVTPSGAVSRASVPGPLAELAVIGDVAVVPLTGRDDKSVLPGLAWVDMARQDPATSRTEGFVSSVVAANNGFLANHQGGLTQVSATEAPTGSAMKPIEPLEWVPSGSHWVGPLVSEVPLMGGDVGCGPSYTQRQWADPQTSTSIVVGTATCGTSGTAFVVARTLYGEITGDPEPAFARDSFDYLASGTDPGPTVVRVWAQGTTVYMVATMGTDTTLDAMQQLNTTTSTQLTRLVGGDQVSPATLVGSIVTSAVGTPLSVYLGIWLAVRWISFLPRARGAMDSLAEVPIPVVSVQDDVTRAKRRRWAHRLTRYFALPYLGMIALAVVLGAATGSQVPIPLASWILGGVCLVGSLAARRWAGRKLPAEQRPGRHWSRTPRGLVGLAIRVVAQVAFAITLAGYLIGAVLLLFEERSIHASGGEGLIWLADAARVGLVTGVHRLGPVGMFSVLFLLSVGCYWLNRFGRRLQMQAMPEVAPDDQTDRFLYLRSFDEDGLKIRASLRGTGPLGFLMPIKRVTFEEILATGLGSVAPVVAYSPPDQTLPPMGAARRTIGPEEDWKAVVLNDARTARAVVLSATPQQINEGFWHELSTVAAVEHQRVILVIGPWKRDASQRWRAFQAAVAQLPLFRPIAAASLPAGLQVLAHQPSRGWIGFGSETRTDWSYALCLQRAAEWVGSPDPRPDAGLDSASATDVKTVIPARAPLEPSGGEDSESVQNS